MSARPRLVRSIPFWVLIIGSLATSAFGAWLAIDKLNIMAETITAGTATGIEVYVGQVWAIVGGILIATGLLGLALALVLGAVRSLLPAPAAAIVAPIDWARDDESVNGVEVVEVVAAPALREPVEETATAEAAAAYQPATESTAESTNESAPQR